MTTTPVQPEREALARVLFEHDCPNNPWLTDEQYADLWGSLLRGPRPVYMGRADAVLAHLAARASAEGPDVVPDDLALRVAEYVADLSLFTTPERKALRLVARFARHQAEQTAAFAARPAPVVSGERYGTVVAVRDLADRPGAEEPSVTQVTIDFKPTGAFHEGQRVTVTDTPAADDEGGQDR